jgi:hypothetical protein
MRLVSIVMAALIAFASVPALAQSTTGRASGLPSNQSRPAPATASTVWSDVEKKVIDEYYRVKARLTGTPSGEASSSTAPRKSTATMRGIPKEVGKADDDDSAAKSKRAPKVVKPAEPAPSLAKGDKLTPAAKHQPLPADLQAKLPAAKPGTDRVLVGNDALLVDKRTNTVLDVIKDAATPKT